MGLLSALDRILPDEQVMGLLRGAGRAFSGGGGYMHAPQAQAPATAQPGAPQQASQRGPGIGRLLEELIVNGQTFGRTRAQYAGAQGKADLYRRVGAMLGGAPMLAGQPGEGAPQTGPTGAPTTQTGAVPFSDPRWGQLALLAKPMGVDIGPVFDWQKANQPDVQFDRGVGYNKKDPSQAGRYHPDLDKGQEPLFDANGRIVGVRNMDGTVQAAAEMAGAVEGAKAKAKAPYEFPTFKGPNGEEVTVSAATAAALGSRGGMVARGQSPAAAAAAKVEAEARAGARVSLPGDIATVDAAIASIDNLSADASLPKRTGLWGVLPAIPGTEGVGFDAQLKQLTGQVFLDAYASLKGAGAITEQEGKAATAAKARLEKAQSEEDFRAALADLRGSLEAGKRRLAQRAGGGSAPGASAPSRAAVEAELRRRGLLK